ncbi:hypothetical protein [Thiocapsa sp. UBA6158]|jgi:hypothetical protein|uniref:hypothetical protein n=1 Tax=Thiocapsa sp. UBA6158 TaxID=1947692 RepID=UPI0025D876CA|nr:hypothetical protein [Thiocapsa sp. UBA6158]
MATHHDLGALPKIGDSLWYVATWQGQWLALLSFSAAPGSVPRATPGSAGIFATIKIVCN